MIKGRISVRSVLAFCVAMCVGGWAFGKPPCSGDELIAIVREGHESLLPDVFYVDTVVPEWKLQKDAEHISIEELLHQLAEQREQVDHARGLMLDPCIGELLAAKGTEVLIAEENRTLYPLSFMQRLAMVMWVDAGRRWREQDLDGAADSLAAIGGVMRVGTGVGGDSGRTLTARTTLRDCVKRVESAEE
ncbi:MAG: hypothetical protein IT435_11465 [Phycisphaerales bacterium]|nr:hypothetical protein [Phycisphaerales bacterium]